MSIRGQLDLTLAACIAVSVVLHACLLALPGNRFNLGGIPVTGSEEPLFARIVESHDLAGEAPAPPPDVASVKLAQKVEPSRVAAPAPPQVDAVPARNEPRARLIAPVGPSGSGAAGLSTVRDSHAPIEVLGSWWDQKFGPLPDPASIPPEPEEPIVLGYPPDAPHRAQVSRVIAAIAVGSTGKVEDIYVLAGDPPWSTYVQSEMREIKYRPATLNGEAVPSFLVYAIDFVPIQAVNAQK